jgi:hypothetical protein
MTPSEAFRPANAGRLKEARLKLNEKLQDRNKNSAANALNVGQRVLLKDFKESKADLSKDAPHWGEKIFVIDHIRVNTGKVVRDAAGNPLQKLNDAGVLQNRTSGTGVKEYYIHGEDDNRDPMTQNKGVNYVGKLSTAPLKQRRRFSRYDIQPIDVQVSVDDALDNAGLIDNDARAARVAAKAAATKKQEAKADDREEEAAKLVGSDIQVHWHTAGGKKGVMSPMEFEKQISTAKGDHGWFAGKIVKYDKDSGEHTIKYDDGQVMKHNLVWSNASYDMDKDRVKWKKG